MEGSFIDREKRFVLAEMIKTSSIDADILAAFVRSNKVEPDWMSMQLPSGRNMHQCMELASQMSIVIPSLKRKPWEDISLDHQAKRIATSERHEQGHHGAEPVAPPPASLSPHIAILPRPTSASTMHHQQIPSQDAPKKRGRPSRADKAKRDLRPILPQPPPVLPPSSNGTLVGPPTSRPILPPILSASPSEPRPITPPEAYIPVARLSNSPRKRIKTSPSEEPTHAGTYVAKEERTSGSGSSFKRLVVE